jgi:enoyl-CoA hydratase/carnithine racemase
VPCAKRGQADGIDKKSLGQFQTRRVLMTYTKLQIQGNIAWVVLNRPKVLNAINVAMLDELWSFAERLQESDISVVVITGEGRGFCSGADISEFGRWKDQPTSVFRSDVRRFHDFYDFLERLEKPVVAAINGVCVGGGLEMAISCDIRIAKVGAKFGYPEARLGLIPNSGGCSRTMRLVGPGRTKEMIMTGDLISAEEAYRVGLVEHVYSEEMYDTEVKNLVGRLAKQAPQALAMTKYAVDNAIETDRGTGRYIERLAQSVLLKTSDHLEGAAAFREKREPKFTGN